MFNFLKGKKTDITITLDRSKGIYYPGETVAITVAIIPDKDLKLKSALFTLNGIEQYQYHTMTSSTDSDGNRTDEDSYPWVDGDLFTSEENFLAETTLPGGTPQRYSFQVKLPADALPSCTGDIVHVIWQASVKIDRSLWGDLQAKTEFIVRTLAPGLDVKPGEYGQSNEPGEAELAFILPGLETVAGQQLSGQLRILPRKDFDGEVRLELVREEDVPSGYGNHAQKTFPFKLAGNTKFTAGQQQIIPFQVIVPPDAAPSLQAPDSSISWMIKAILNRRLRKDTTIEQVFSVYPAKE